MYSILKNKLKGMRQDVLDFAAELVRIPSTSCDEGAVAERVEQEMTSLGYDRVIRDDAGNVVGILSGRDEDSSILLNSHMDTVPPEGAGAWDRAPYSGVIEGGKLHGRGACDCKGGIAAQIYAGALLRRALLPMKGNLVVAMTVAEANGMSLGVKELLRKTLPAEGLRPAFAILGEPTMLGLHYGHDGWMEMEVQVEGRNPFHVENAAKAIVQDLSISVRSRESEPEEMAVGRPRFVDGDGLRRAFVKVERRLSASEHADSVVQSVNRGASMVAQASGSVAVRTAIRAERHTLYNGFVSTAQRVTHAWAMDPFDPLMERARQSLAAATGNDVHPHKWELGRLGMGTAGGVMVKEFSLPTVGYGPGDEKVAHQTNEYVETERIVECVYGTAAIAHGLIGVPVFGWSAEEI